MKWLLCLLLIGCSTAKEKPFPVLEHKPFVIIIPSYNNGDWVAKNLRSALDQRYDHFRILFIDDASTDSTLIQAQTLISSYPSLEGRVEIQHNETRRGAAENIFRAIHSCKQEEIVILLDGDDFLAHDHVLERLNTIYANPDVWLTYGSYLEYPNYGYTVANFARPLPQKEKVRAYSKKHWSLSHLRTFYAGLFHPIQLKDLLFEGNYFDAASDVGFMIPLVEMAGERAHFVEDILCLYNRSNPLNDHKVRAERQRKIAEHVLQLPPYARLASLDPPHKAPTADLVIFSYDRPLQLYALLESVTRYCKGLHNVHILYRCSTPDYSEAYNKVATSFPHTHFLQEQDNFKPLLLHTLQTASSPYILFAVDDDLITEEIDLVKDCKALQSTGAYGLYYRLGAEISYCYMLNREQKIPSLPQVESDLFAWDFSLGADADWGYPTSLDLTLYDRETVLSQIAPLPFTHPPSLESLWDKKVNRKRIGLCHAHSKMINIPLNLVNPSSNRALHSFSSEELLLTFNAGLKIDINPLAHYPHTAPHVDYTPTFVQR